MSTQCGGDARATERISCGATEIGGDVRCPVPALVSLDAEVVQLLVKIGARVRE
jgi:hypothetical protein